jgi:hypothetical protein
VERVGPEGAKVTDQEGFRTTSPPVITMMGETSFPTPRPRD